MLKMGRAQAKMIQVIPIDPKSDISSKEVTTGIFFRLFIIMNYVSMFWMITPLNEY